MAQTRKIAVVIPTYKAKKHIVDVLNRIPALVTNIYVVDDKCPEKSGEYAEEQNSDNRVNFIFHDENKGVGGATVTGLKAAFEDGCEIAIKVDSDGQIDPALIPELIEALETNNAGYAKGSRFMGLGYVGDMPRYRLFLNAILSITNKFASGYYSITDPTNGFFAITEDSFEKIKDRKIAERYFFESDMLFHLNIARVKVVDIPMKARYEDEQSGLKIRDEIFNFAGGNIKNFIKRVLTRHFLLNFSIPAIYLLGGLITFFWGLFLGGYRLISNSGSDVGASAGIVIVPAILLIIGFNMLTSFLIFDVNDEPGKQTTHG